MLMCSVSASAHVKWFAPYDLIAEPVGLNTLLTNGFTLIAVISIVTIFILALLDRKMVNTNLWLDSCRTRITQALPQYYEFTMMRYTLLIFFTAVWVLGDVILTPELKHQSTWVSGLQLLIIASLVSNYTARYAGAGIIMLWIYSAYHYGFFHMSDYMIFLGIAIFIILSSLNPDNDSSLKRYLILYISISFTLQWASIEKFVYPHWFYPVLEDFPHLTMGLSSAIFVTIAGFGEFVLAFMLIAASGVAFFALIFVLALMFIAAIYDFGQVDAIGHLAIIIALLLMILHGPIKINIWFANLHSKPMVNACYVTLAYCASLVCFFVIYYLIRKAWLLTATY
jgi:hypothetical protein